MIINHNMASLNTYRQLSANNANSAKSLEKLSSGLRINKAGDDAAGLAISEKMRGQIRGLDQASRNAQDAISLVQTAEGSLNETHSILQRMKELATQASNDTNTGNDRKEIQKEINQLTSEITRIGANTEFNTQKLLDGSQNTQAAKAGTITGSAAMDLSALSLTDASATVDITVGSTTYQLDKAALEAAFDGANGSDDIVAAIGNATDGVGSLSDDADVSFDSATGKLTITAKTAATGTDVTFGITTTNVGDYKALQTAFGVTDGTTGAGADASTGGGLTFQIGANQGQQFTITISDMRSSALGISGAAGGNALGVGTDAGDDVSGASFVALAAAGNDLTDTTAGVTNERALDVSDADKASAAIKVLDQAINSVSAERSKLGAYSNRLEHTVTNLGTSSENLTAAESRVRDVDMAKEMMNFQKNNILSQAAQAMLAQANQAPQGVLQLLR